jgi:hypothetical protein
MHVLSIFLSVVFLSTCFQRYFSKLALRLRTFARGNSPMGLPRAMARRQAARDARQSP